MSSTTVSHSESARLAGVLEEMLDRLSLVSTLPPRVQQEPDDAGASMFTVLSALRASERDYLEANSAREAAKAASLKAKVAETTETMRRISVTLRSHLRALCRVVKESTDVGSDVALGLGERAALVSLLETTLSELGTSSSYAPLAATVASEAAAAREPARLTARERELTEANRAAAEELATIAEKRAEILAKKRAETAAVTAQLTRARSENSLALRFARKEAGAHVEAVAFSADLGERDAAAEIAELSERLNQERSVAETTAKMLQAEIAAITAEVDAWRAKLVADAPAKKAELETVTEKCAKLHAEFIHLQTKYEADVAEAKALMAVPLSTKENEFSSLAKVTERKATATTISHFLGERAASHGSCSPNYTVHRYFPLPPPPPALPIFSQDPCLLRSKVRSMPRRRKRRRKQRRRAGRKSKSRGR